MKLITWFVQCVCVMVAEVLALLLTPFVVLAANRDTGKLPAAFWWMETPTAPLPGPASITGDILASRGWYWAAVYWLWRNSAYGLSDSFRVDPPLDNVTYWHVGNQATGVKPYTPGVFLGTMTWQGGWAFELRAIWPMPFGKCGMFRLGWKLSSWFSGERPEKPTATGMIQVPSIRPFQTRG